MIYMDLISRKAVLDGVDKYIEKAQSTGTEDDFISFAELGVKALPSAFEGMTNGETLKALFPIEGIYKDVDFVEVVFKGEIHTTYFTRDFWDSPYKRVSE